MQVKKFEAPTMQEALKVIKKELGSEAIILSTKHIRSGFGLMSKASVEVTAAIAEKDLKKKLMAEKNLPQDVKEKIWNSKAEKQSEIYNNYFERQLKNASKDKVELSAAKKRIQQSAMDAEAKMDRNEHHQKKSSPPPSHAPQGFAQASAKTLSPFAQAPSGRAIAQTSEAPRERRYIDIDEEELAEKNAKAPAPNQSSNAKNPSANAQSAKVVSLEKDIEQLKNLVSELAASNQSSGTTAVSRDEIDGELTEEVIRVMHDLVANGIEKKIARQIIREATFDLSNLEKHDEQVILDKVAYRMVDAIQVKDLLSNVGAKSGVAQSTVVAMVGPTGVGKTTTIAKIASLGILEKGLRVGLINLDSYKVAAADQLATYAKIMNVPFRSVNNREELQQAIYDFASLDLVLIDTTGRSQKDQESLLQLRHMLANIEGCQSVLMISTTTKDADLNEVISRFKIFSPVGMVFSKLDETSVYGCILNAQKKCNLPLLYFTVGQRVPEDIEKASAERVVDLILDN
jgi:flagellar biosynthesis protein FlhF